MPRECVCTFVHACVRVCVLGYSQSSLGVLWWCSGGTLGDASTHRAADGAEPSSACPSAAAAPPLLTAYELSPSTHNLQGTQGYSRVLKGRSSTLSLGCGSVLRGARGHSTVPERTRVCSSVQGGTRAACARGRQGRGRRPPTAPPMRADPSPGNEIASQTARNPFSPGSFRRLRGKGERWRRLWARLVALEEL